MSDTIGENVKKEILERFIIDVGKMSIMVFNGLDLKTHIEGIIVDDETADEYVITVNKVSNGALFKDGGIVFTRKQRNKFAIDFYAWMQDRYRQVGDGFVEDLNMDVSKRVTATVEHVMDIYNFENLKP